MNIREELSNFSKENKITIAGIVITFLMSAYSLYLQHKIEISLEVISNFYSTTTLGEKVEHRLTFINSGNTPIAVESVNASIKKLDGEIVNSKIDVIPPFVIDKKDIKVIDLNHILIGKSVSGLHKTGISFSVVDANGEVHKSTYDLGQLSIGDNITNGKFKYPSYKFDLINGTRRKLNRT